MIVRAFKMRLEYGMGPEFEKRHAEVWTEEPFRPTAAGDQEV